MDWVTSQFTILLGKDLSVAGDDITGVLLEEADKAKIKLTVTLDCICIMLDGLDQLSLLDVHCLHSETALFLLELVVHDLLKAHAFEAKQVD